MLMKKWFVLLLFSLLFCSVDKVCGNLTGALPLRSCPEIPPSPCICNVAPLSPANSVVHFQTIQCADQCFYLIEERLVPVGEQISAESTCSPSDYAAILRVVDCQCNQVGDPLYSVVKPLRFSYDEQDPTTDPFTRMPFMAQPILYNLSSGAYVLTLYSEIAEQLFCATSFHDVQGLLSYVPLVLDVHKVSAAGFELVGSVDLQSDAFVYGTLPSSLPQFEEACNDFTSMTGTPCAFIPVECDGKISLLLVEFGSYSTSKIFAFGLQGMSFEFLNSIELQGSAYTKHLSFLFVLQYLYLGNTGQYSRLAESVLSRLSQHTFFDCGGHCRFFNIIPYGQSVSTENIVEVYDFNEITGFTQIPTAAISAYQPGGSPSIHNVFSSVKTCGDQCYVVVNEFFGGIATITRFFIATEYGFEQVELDSTTAPGVSDEDFIPGIGYLNGAGARVFLGETVITYLQSCGDKCFLFMMHYGDCYGEGQSILGLISNQNLCINSIDVWQVANAQATYLGTAEGSDGSLLAALAYVFPDPILNAADNSFSLFFGSYFGVVAGLSTKSYDSMFDRFLVQCGEKCVFSLTNGSDQQVFSIDTYGVEEVGSLNLDPQFFLLRPTIFSCGQQCYAIPSAFDFNAVQDSGGSSAGIGMIDIYKLDDYGVFTKIQSISSSISNAVLFIPYAQMVVCPDNGQCVLLLGESSLVNTGGSAFSIEIALRAFILASDGTFVEIEQVKRSQLENLSSFSSSEGFFNSFNLDGINLMQAVGVLGTSAFFNQDMFSFIGSLFKDQIMMPSLASVNTLDSRFNFQLADLACLLNPPKTPFDAAKLAVCSYAEMIKIGVDPKTLVCLLQPFVNDQLFVCRILRCILETPGMGIGVLQSWLFSIGQQPELSLDDRVALGKNIITADLGGPFITKQVRDFVNQYMLFGLADGLNHGSLINCQLGIADERNAIEALVQQLVTRITES